MHTFALALLLALGQGGGALTGTVVDPSGAPVPDATVRLELAGAPAGELRTGNDGQFSRQDCLAPPAPAS